VNRLDGQYSGLHLGVIFFFHRVVVEIVVSDDAEKHLTSCTCMYKVFNKSAQMSKTVMRLQL